MFKKSNFIKISVIAILFMANNVYAEVDCESPSQSNIENLKPLTMQKQNKSITTKIPAIKSSKSTKGNTEYLGVLKLLIPDGLR
jgi:hypothetical protein